MNLTDNEKRDIVKYIEAGKSLPDKFRFLLFGDKREVELVWNGKTNEITNVVLPFQVIEQVDEPRSEKEAKMQGELFDFSGRRGNAPSSATVGCAVATFDFSFSKRMPLLINL